VVQVALAFCIDDTAISTAVVKEADTALLLKRIWLGVNKQTKAPAHDVFYLRRCDFHVFNCASSNGSSFGPALLLVRVDWLEVRKVGVEFDCDLVGLKRIQVDVAWVRIGIELSIRKRDPDRTPTSLDNRIALKAGRVSLRLTIVILGSSDKDLGPEPRRSAAWGLEIQAMKDPAR